MGSDSGVRTLRCGDQTLMLDRTRVMAVVNVTPDSFSDGGRFAYGDGWDLGALREVAAAMIEAGAVLIDVGGESTRPGAGPVSGAEELRRVMPVVETLLAMNTLVSVDTSKAQVAKQVIAAGCHMINDVQALSGPGMLEVVAGSAVAVCLMHMQGEPRTMQQAPVYADVVAEVGAFLAGRIDGCREVGISDERLCVDPGFGFGKTLGHNISLLNRLEEVRVDNLPLLAGLSRKGMIGTLTAKPVTERVAGSVAAALLAALGGADIVRVHDVAETTDALKVLEATRH